MIVVLVLVIVIMGLGMLIQRSLIKSQVEEIQAKDELIEFYKGYDKWQKFKEDVLTNERRAN